MQIYTKTHTHTNMRAQPCHTREVGGTKIHTHKLKTEEDGHGEIQLLHNSVATENRAGLSV